MNNTISEVAKEALASAASKNKDSRKRGDGADPTPLVSSPVGSSLGTCQLDQLGPTTQGVIQSITNGNQALRSRLMALGFTANAIVTMVATAPLNDPVVVSIGNRLVSMRRVEARSITVTPVVTTPRH